MVYIFGSFLLFTIFVNWWKVNFSQNLGGVQSPSPTGFYGPTYHIWCFCSFFDVLRSNVSDGKCHRTHKQKRRVLVFTRIKLVARVLACVCVYDRTHEMEKNGEIQAIFTKVGVKATKYTLIGWVSHGNKLSS